MLMLFVMVAAAFLAGGVAARLAWVRPGPTSDPLDRAEAPRQERRLAPLLVLAEPPSSDTLADDELDLRLADFLAADGVDEQSRRWLLGPEVGV